MAKADQIKALISSHGDGDDSRFYAIAMQVAAHAARSGHGRFAQELRELVDKAKALAGSSRSRRPIPLAQPRGELSGLVVAAYPATRLTDLVLETAVLERLERVILEQRQRARIAEHGYAPLRKLLLVGAPGTGKTMTAAALAGELSLPLFSVQLHGLITKYMGETAAKLRLIFDAMDETRGVYLFDEFDAFGGDREARNDVGEIRRVLNSFLQFLEQDDSDSVVVAATNHPRMLDKALFRRFDMVTEYSLPGPALAEAVMRARLAPLDTTGVGWSQAVSAAEGLSHGEIARACEQAAKNAILAHTTNIRTDALVSALQERRWDSSPSTR